METDNFMIQTMSQRIRELSAEVARLETHPGTEVNIGKDRLSGHSSSVSLPVPASGAAKP